MRRPGCTGELIGSRMISAAPKGWPGRPLLHHMLSCQGDSMRVALLLLGLAVSVAVAVAPGAAVAQAARPFGLCVVDENVLVARSPVAPKMAERFQQVRNQAQQSFQADSAQLEADARALASSRARLPAAEVKARQDEIERRRASLRQRGDEINRNLAALDAELTKNVVELAKPAIRTAAAELGCSAVAARSTLLDLGDMSLDITVAVVRTMEGELPR